MKVREIPDEIRRQVKKGVVIPAVPLALTAERNLDRSRQRAVLKYYIEAGAGGIAIGVHSTQFAIREPGIDLFEPVLALASETVDDYAGQRGSKILKIAGVCGRSDQALREAEFARKTGYHAVLLSLSAFPDAPESAMIEHCRRVANVMPVFGFYLQPSVGGRLLDYSFWRRFCEIENILGIKIAPFNRYQTLDVVRAVCNANREDDITLYTGNDDQIVLDLLTEYRMVTTAGERLVRIAGGLLGHWSVWVKKAVELLEEIHRITDSGRAIPPELLTRAQEITDANAAFFDAAHNYAGVIPGIHEVLRRQGIFRGRWCLDPEEDLSPGQSAEIDRVYRSYPHLNDDAFVRENLNRWLED
jgi:dihydrodipicolinate synthase/N-acetylneuraminate lyase